MSPIFRSALAALSIGLAAHGASAQSVLQGPIVNPGNGHTYYAISGSNNVFALRTFARNLGGDLVTVNNAAENTWLWNTLVAPWGFDFYIGYNDANSEGDFVWFNGEPATFTFWAPGEPNDFEGEDYATIRLSGTRWNDVASGGAVNAAIVEIENNGSCAGAREIAAPSETFDTLDQCATGGLTCASGPAKRVWFSFIGNERAVNINTCEGDAANFDTILEVFRGDCGGLVCVAISDDALCGFHGLSGSSVDLFAKGGERYYIAVQDFDGHDTSAYTFQLTVNQDDTTPPQPTIVPGAPIYNPATTTTYYRTTPGIWNDQQALAQTIEGNLVTINDDAENTLVASFAPAPFNTLLIGFNDRANEGYFAWASGQTPDYSHWLKGQPDDDGNEDYIRLDASGGWADVNAAAVLPALIEVASDSCYGAQPLTVPTSLTADYVRAAVGAGEIPCGSTGVNGSGVWYHILGDGSTITASTCTGLTTFDTTLRVFTGDCASINCVAANDDGCGGPGGSGPYAVVSFYAEPGRVYSIVVGSWSDTAQSGIYTLTLTTSGPLSNPPFLARSAANPDTCTRYYVMAAGPFPLAAAAARNVDLHLASVSSAAENTFIRAFADSQNVSSAWLGLSDFDADGEFAWLDGSPLTYTNWNTGEPNGGVQEFYAELLPTGAWNDNGNRVLRSIVKAPITADVGGHIRGALRFGPPGAAARLPTDALPWPNIQHTTECWFRTDAHGVILGQHGAGSGGGGYVPLIYVGLDGRIRAAEWSGDPESSVVTGPVVNDGAWRHVAVVREFITLSLYIDAVLVGSIISATLPYDSAYAYALGDGLFDGWPGGDAASHRLNGDIDEFRYWTSALTEADIRARKDTRSFNPDLYPDLLLHLDLDDAGGFAFDSKSRHHAYLEGATTWLYEDRNADKAPDVCQPTCPADIDGNGVVNSTDVSEFINTWFADQANGTINADFNRNGTTNSTDVSDLINAYFEASGDCLS